MVPFVFSSLVLTICTLWLYTADIKYRPNNLDVSGASNHLSSIEYACKASWSMITTGHVEITFVFFPMLIFNVDFQCLFSMLIFDVDFQC